MTRSRIVVLASSLVVSAGALTALGAFYMAPARAAVGPLPGEALSLPADTRFVMGFDVQRYVQSPLYQRQVAEKQKSGRPDSFAELEQKTGLNPERDVDQIIVAGGARGQKEGVILVSGRFDRYKVARAIETSGKPVTTKKVEGTTVYLFEESKEGKARGAVAFLDDNTLAMGTQAIVEAVIAGRAGAPLSENKPLMALIESVRPGSTFWMVGDQTLLADMPRSVPAPGAGGAAMQLPGLKSLVVTGDLDPVVAFDVTGEASDEAAARNLADIVRGFVALVNLQAAQRPELKDLASAVSVTTEATKLRIQARVPYEVIDSLKAAQEKAAAQRKTQAATPASPAAQ